MICSGILLLWMINKQYLSVLWGLKPLIIFLSSNQLVLFTRALPCLLCRHMCLGRLCAQGGHFRTQFHNEILNAFSQNSQLNGFSPMWLRLWMVNSDDVLNAFWHNSKLNGFSLVWICLWLVNSVELLNVFLQNPH